MKFILTEAKFNPTLQRFYEVVNEIFLNFNDEVCKQRNFKDQEFRKLANDVLYKKVGRRYFMGDLWQDLETVKREMPIPDISKDGKTIGLDEIIFYSLDEIVPQRYFLRYLILIYGLLNEIANAGKVNVEGKGIVDVGKEWTQQVLSNCQKWREFLQDVENLYEKNKADIRQEMANNYINYLKRGEGVGETFEIFEKFVIGSSNFVKTGSVRKFASFLVEFYFDDEFSSVKQNEIFLKENKKDVLRFLTALLSSKPIDCYRELQNVQKSNWKWNFKDDIFFGLERLSEVGNWNSRCAIPENYQQVLVKHFYQEEGLFGYTTSTNNKVQILFQKAKTPNKDLEVVEQFYQLMNRSGITNDALSRIKFIAFLPELGEVGKVGYEKAAGYYYPANYSEAKNGITIFEKSSNPLRTLVHEFGHLLHFNSNTQAQGFWRDFLFKGGTETPISPVQDKTWGGKELFKEPEKLPTEYSKENLKEAFAETFLFYILARDKLDPDTLYAMRKFLSLSNFYGGKFTSKIHEILKEQILSILSEKSNGN